MNTRVSCEIGHPSVFKKTSIKSLKSLNTQIQNVCCSFSNSNDTGKTATLFLAIWLTLIRSIGTILIKKKVEVVQKREIPSLRSLSQV